MPLRSDFGIQEGWTWINSGRRRRNSGGSGAEKISPLKINSDQWLEVMQTAHELGLKSSATMMFGHVETIEDRVEHLRRIRDQQDRSGGFTAFICWTFQPQHTVLKIKHPTGVAEYLRTQALARIFG